MRKILNKFKTRLLAESYSDQEKTLHLLAKLNIDRIVQKKKINSFFEIEFKVYSQWGDDGIIQYLVNKIPVKNKIFIEFGVEKYTEANTRFLLMNNNWTGLVMDGSKADIASIKSGSIYWKYDLTARQAFITKDNINSLIQDFTSEKDIGLLSIDIDGNDYWVWEAISAVSPAIVVCEYNSLFGVDRALTIPYREDFFRTSAHFSNLYFGASLKALVLLAGKKGYDFVGCTSAGNNAYFVRRDLNKLKALTPKQGFIASRFKESRDKKGRLNFLRAEERLKAIKDMDLFDISKNELMKIADIFNI